MQHSKTKVLAFGPITSWQIDGETMETVTDFLLFSLFLFFLIFKFIPQGCFFFPLIFISWRLITSQYCSGFCHTLT